MSKSLNQLLAAQVLTGVIQQTLPGLPNPLPPQLMSIIDRKVPSNYGTYTQYANTRQVSQITQYGAPSVTYKLSEIGTKNVTLISSSENVLINQTDYMALRNYDNPMVQEMGAQEVARQIGQQKMRITNLRISAIASAFAKGAIYWDGPGNLLPSSAGAVSSVDYGVSATHKGSLNGILTNWSVNSTDIINEVNTVKRQALSDTGYPLMHVIYGRNVPGYIANNDSVRNFIRGSQSVATQFYQNGEIPNNFLGLNWIPGYTMFFKDQYNVTQWWFDDDAVVFIPDPNPMWWGNLEGSIAICSDLGRVDIGANAPQDAITIATGDYAYAVATNDPVNLKIVTGTNFLPVLKVPDAVFIGDCTN